MKIDARMALEETRVRLTVEKEIKAGTDRELVGTLYVAEEGLSWRPKNAKIPIDADWEDFIDWMKS